MSDVDFSKMEMMLRKEITLAGGYSKWSERNDSSLLAKLTADHPELEQEIDCWLDDVLTSIMMDYDD